MSTRVALALAATLAAGPLCACAHRGVNTPVAAAATDISGLELDVPAFDNFGGMCFGPTLADGSRTLLLVSDDNFGPRQRTWFLLFRILT